MDKQMIEKIWVELEKLAQSTGVAVEKLYVMLEQQSKVQLTYDILALIGMVVLVIVGVYLSKYFFKKEKDSDYYGDWGVAGVVVAIFTGAIGVVSFFCIAPVLIEEIVQIIINPPIWILEYVMNLIK